MKEQLISFDTAKLAKKKGVKVESYPVYSFDGILVNNYTNAHRIYPAPTQSLLHKWLRDTHNIHVIPYIISGLKYYAITALKPKEDGTLGCDDLFSREIEILHFKTYEDALEVGLQESLKLIKKL
jgi:hypothetical protein